ncbi:MAG: CtsR family transcriptional regulator [Clostridium sp.]
MARLSDVIESFIKEMFNRAADSKVIIQRNELADQFRCAPSQINYVLTTRFTYEKGYIIESRRGGGGCIVIKEVTFTEPEKKNKMINEKIGDSITYHNSLILLEHLYDLKLISNRELELMKIAINDRTLGYIDDRNKIRADILKAMTMVILS